MARLSWLHLSDLHLGLHGTGWLRPEYREEFERDLRRLHERTGPWDLVLISGALTQKGSKREFELLNTALESFWAVLRNLGSEPLLLAVPGHQDASVLNMLGLADAEDVREAFASPESSTESSTVKQIVQESFAPFCDWLEGWQKAHPAKGIQTTLHGGLLPGDFTLTVRKQGLDIGIVGLNSLFQKAGRNYEVSEEQLALGSDRAIRAWAQEKNAVLLLTRQPPTRLRYKALTLLLQNGIAPKGRYLLHLCGGWNEGHVSEPISSLAHPVPYYQAPSLFSTMHQDSRKKAGPMGYAVGELEIRDTSGRLRLFPRVVSFTKLGSAVLVPDERHPLEKDESVTLSFPLEQSANPVRALPLPAAAPSSEEPRARPPSAPSPASVTPPPGAVPPPLPAGVKLQEVLTTGRELVGWLTWAPSGDALAIGLASGHIHYWRPGEESSRWVAVAHESKIVDLCFSPDGGMLASRDPELVRFWNVDDHQATRGSPPVHKAPGQNVAWSSRGLLAVGTSYGRIELWDTKTWTRVADVQIAAHMNTVLCLAWSPDGRMLACGGAGQDPLLLWDVVGTDGTLTLERSDYFVRPDDAILHLAWMPGTSRFAMASKDGLLQIWDASKALSVVTLESHTDTVTAVAFSFDGRLLASKSLDGTVQLFRTDTWEPVARLDEPAARNSFAGLAFSPNAHVLATLTPGGRGIRLWALDVNALLGSREDSPTVHAINAKVVLVGEGRAGKSCLALRMVKNSYEELSSTHGMQFWSIPVEPPESPGEGPSPTQREIILWDMGGQSEYRLVHQLFLRDSTVALMVMEPGRGQAALDELEGWNQRFLAQTSTRPVQKLLVGTKLDDEHAPENLPALRNLVAQGSYTAYLPTSAKTGRGVAELKRQLVQTIDWQNIEKVSRPRLFQRIRQHLQRLRKSGRVVLLLADLQQELRESEDGPVDPEALRIVVAQLSRQGLVADTWLADGTRALILEVEQVERYAGSIILAARNNPHGVPAIDVATVMSPEMSFPRMPQQERLRRDQELMVLDCVIQMLLKHDLCLLHQGLLVFPSLFQPLPQEGGPGFSHAISLCYDFSGPIDTIYASLIASLAMSQRFGAMRLWEDRAEFGRAGEDVSGVHKVQPAGQGARGLARLDVYFDTETPKPTRELFVNFVEEHLRKRGVKLRERLAITCACGKVFPEEIVGRRISEGLTDIGCEMCDRRTPLTLGAQQSRESNPELVQQLEALRTQVREKRSQSVDTTKAEISGARAEPTTPDTPLRILHLSDLHMGEGEDPLNLLQPLIADLTDRRDGLGVERLDHLVISGDLTNRASPQEFEKAYQFVSGLIQEFGLTAERCIIVPGNHDLDWETEVYVWKKKRQVELSRLVPGTYRELADGWLHLREDAKYPERFKNFSQQFYHPLYQKEYPLPAAQQCVVSSFFDSRLQFLALNSAWQIDESFQDRSGIHEGALSHGLAEADRQLADARRAGKLRGEKVLRISVLHHPITGNEKIHDDAFLKRLQQADVRLCLHGHVHEDRADLVGYLHPTRKLHVVGAGSFGAPTHHRPESVPRLYNLLEVRRDLGSVRVHTRCMRKQGGTWEAWAVWPGERPDERRPSASYKVELP